MYCVVIYFAIWNFLYSILQFAFFAHSFSRWDFTGPKYKKKRSWFTLLHTFNQQLVDSKLCSFNFCFAFRLRRRWKWANPTQSSKSVWFHSLRIEWLLWNFFGIDSLLLSLFEKKKLLKILHFFNKTLIWVFTHLTFLPLRKSLAEQKYST